VSANVETRTPNRAAPYLALLAVQALFGTWPIAGKIILRSLSPIGLVTFRILGASIALLVLQFSLKKPLALERKRDLASLALLSLLGVVLNQVLFVKGLALTTAINATLLAATIPVFAHLTGVAARTEFLTTRKVIGIIVAGAGVVYLVNPSRTDLAHNSWGDLLLIINSFCYGVYIALSKDLVRKYGPLTVVTWVFVLGNVVMIPLSLIEGSYQGMGSLSGGTWACLAYVVLFPTVGAYFLNGWALARVDPSVVAVFIYIQPVFAFALAPIILGETLGPRILLATALIFAGVFIVTWRRRYLRRTAAS
jgi:drug/metabolite transporter (DMT)-like permease